MTANFIPNLHEVAVFIEVARAGTFSEAGRRLHLSQPAVSRAIGSLENQLGARLFTRQGRATQMTEAGQALLPAALELVGASKNLQETMSHLDDRVAGDLSVGCSTTSGKYLLPGLIAAFRSEQPSVRVSIDIMSHDEVLARLLDGQLAAGVVSRRAPSRELEYKPFFDDHVVLIVPARHAWAAYGQALPADLLDQPLIMREPGAGATTVLLEALVQHGIRPDMLNIAMQVASTEAITMAVEEGLGIAFVSESVAEARLALGRIRRVEVEGLDLHEVLYAVRNAESPSNRAKELLWAFVADHPAQQFASRPNPLDVTVLPTAAPSPDWQTQISARHG